MSEQEFLEYLENCIMCKGEEEEEDDELQTVALVRTFEEALRLTQNKGLVISLDDGSEFQVTIVKAC